MLAEVSPSTVYFFHPRVHMDDPLGKGELEVDPFVENRVVHGAHGELDTLVTRRYDVEAADDDDQSQDHAGNQDEKRLDKTGHSFVQCIHSFSID